MDSGKINQWLTLGVNVGVLIGIAFVVVELDRSRAQEREFMLAEVRHGLAMAWIDILSWSATDQALAGVIRRGDLGERLTADESGQYSHRAAAVFRFWQDVHHQYHAGLYDQSQYAAHRLAIVEYLNESRAMVEYWCHSRLTYDPGFAAEIDGNLSTFGC